MNTARVYFQKLGNYWVASNWVTTATFSTKEEAVQFCKNDWKAEHVVEVPVL